MTVNNVVLDDYIIIPPQIGETWIQYIESQFGIIKICSNVVLQLDKIISSKHVTNSSLSYGGTIHAIVDVRLFSDLGIYRFPPQGGYIRKKEINYENDMRNVQYNFSTQQIRITHVPYRSVLIYSLVENIISLICPDYATLNYLLPSMLKNAVAFLAKKQGFTPMHCAAVEKDGQVSIIVGRGRSGKSTLYLNLIEKKMNPFNDDIVFIKATSNGIKITTFPLFAKFRLEGLPYVSDRFAGIPFDSSLTLEDEIYIDCEKLFLKNNQGKGKLKAVVFPSIMKDINAVRVTTLSEKKKPLIREMVMCNGTDQIDGLLCLCHAFEGVKMYELDVTKDVQGACDMLVDLL